jgi:hypothetical protein
MAFRQSGTSQTIQQVSERFETDRFGIDTVELVVKIPDNLFPSQVLSDFAPHPRFSNMLLSRRSGSRNEPGYMTVSYLFEGFLDEAPEEPTYELLGSLSQEPIQTHPDFSTVIAGTPNDAKNGAIFVDPQTRLQSEASNAVFKEFLNSPEPGSQSKAGVDSYLEPSVEWRETKFQKTRPNSVTDLGNIQDPAGNPPDLAPRDWIVWSYSYIRRGALYQVTTTWRMSGRNGWDPDIYDSE